MQKPASHTHDKARFAKAKSFFNWIDALAFITTDCFTAKCERFLARCENETALAEAQHQVVLSHLFTAAQQSTFFDLMTADPLKVVAIMQTVTCFFNSITAATNAMIVASGEALPLTISERARLFQQQFLSSATLKFPSPFNLDLPSLTDEDVATRLSGYHDKLYPELTAERSVYLNFMPITTLEQAWAANVTFISGTANHVKKLTVATFKDGKGIKAIRSETDKAERDALLKNTPVNFINQLSSYYRRIHYPDIHCLNDYDFSAEQTLFFSKVAIITRCYLIIANAYCRQRIQNNDRHCCTLVLKRQSNCKHFRPS